MASRDQLERQRELNRLERERAGISDAMAGDIRQTSNVIKEQTRFLGLQKTEKEEIRKLNREINQLARDNFDISLSELANQKTLTKINLPLLIQSPEKYHTILTIKAITLTKMRTERYKNHQVNIITI